MTITWISNYINHHQIPVCEALYSALGDAFHFVETMPMEQERREMGWQQKNEQPYLIRGYEERERADALVTDADIALIGWAQREDLVEERMKKNLPTIRLSERLYREGQWKRFSPRGLCHKYNEHIRYRNKPLWLLAIGAYTASDFRLIHAYPGKIYRWGYFPPLDVDEGWQAFRDQETAGDQETVQLLWAGRFLELKHPEFPLWAADRLRPAGTGFHLTMIGDGEMRAALEQYCAEKNLTDHVTFTGFLSTKETRARMKASQIFLFTSNHLEGWGAVVSEAMGEGLAVVAGNEAGGPATLIRPGVNGLLYRGNDRQDFYDALKRLVDEPALAKRMGEEARCTIRRQWNAEHAAGELLRFCTSVLSGTAYDPPKDGPMSMDPGVRPFVPAGGAL